MQNIGFAYSLAPIANLFACKKQKILQRHVDTFSTHPYMASIIVGSVAHLEAKSSHQYEEIMRQKQALMGPYAALGDPFFWGSLRPASAIIGVSSAFAGFAIAPILFLIIFNAVHFWIRGTGFIEAFRYGTGALDFLKKLKLPEAARKIRGVSLFFLALLAGSSFFFWQPFNTMFSDVIEGPAVFAVIFISLFLMARRVSPIVILYGISILSFVIAP